MSCERQSSTEWLRQVSGSSYWTFPRCPSPPTVTHFGTMPIKVVTRYGFTRPAGRQTLAEGEGA